MAMTDLEGNGIRARLTTGGDLWWDGNEGLYLVSEETNPSTLNTPSAAFAGGLWVIGRDPGGAIKGSAQQYGRAFGSFDYLTGPLDENGLADVDCGRWDRFWKVTAEDLRTYFSDFDPNAPNVSAIPANIAGWPGAGNPLFADHNGFELPAAEHGYAPFLDVNEDGIYDPRDGDYPLFCGEQAVWCIFNSDGVNQSSGIVSNPQTEIQLLAYSYTTNPTNPLQYTTFYDYKIINRGAEDLLDLYAGLWVDFDLGCFTDDFLGSIPENNLVYVHNDQGTDRPFCDGGVSSFETPGVVQMAQIVNASVPEGAPLLAAFSTPFNNGIGSPIPGTTDPSTPTEYYNYMQGRWGDGSAITRGGNGFQQDGAITRYAFDGGPLPDGTPWLSCRENLPFGDLRSILSTGPYNLQPQEIATFSVAMTTLFNVDFPTSICPDTAPIIAAGAAIKEIYDGFCSPDGLVNTEDIRPQSLKASAYPNPTANSVTFELPAEESIGTIEIFDIAGRLLTSIPAAGSRQTVHLKGLVEKPGVYLYRLRANSGKLAAGRLLLTE